MGMSPINLSKHLAIKLDLIYKSLDPSDYLPMECGR